MADSDLSAKLAALREKQAVVRDIWARSGNRTLIQFFVDIMPRVVGCERLSIFIHDPENSSVWLQCGTGVRERQINVPRSNSLVGQAIHSQQTLTKSDMANQKGAHEHVDKMTGFVTHSAIAVPIRNSKGEAIGAIEALNKIGYPRFSSDDQQILERLASEIVSSVEGLYARQEMFKISLEIEARIRTLEEAMGRR
jgi:GAF domain-containing protein